MIPFYVVIAACLILGTGHIGWGIIHPFKALRESNADLVVRASLHACWYHISVIFYATAGLLLWHVAVSPISVDLMVLLWVLIFLCWLCYLGALLLFPQFWRIAWFQMALIVVLLGNLGYGIFQGTGSA